MDDCGKAWIVLFLMPKDSHYVRHAVQKQAARRALARPGRREFDRLLGGDIELNLSGFISQSVPPYKTPAKDFQRSGNRLALVIGTGGDEREPSQAARSSLVAQAAGSGPAMVATTRNKWTLWARRRTPDPGQHGGPGSRKHGSSPVQRGPSESLRADGWFSLDRRQTLTRKHGLQDKVQ